MNWIWTIAACGTCSLIAAAITWVRCSYRLSEAVDEAGRYREKWIRDSGRMMIAQASLDLIHQQHVDAGRAAHAPFKALRAETTEKLMQCVAKRDANDVSPDVISSSSGIPADPSAGSKQGGSGIMRPDMPTGRGRGVLPPTQAVAPQRQIGRRSYPTNRAAESTPADHTQAKGA